MTDMLIASDSLKITSQARLVIKTIDRTGWVFGSSVVIAASNGLLSYQEPDYDSRKYMVAAIGNQIWVMNIGEIPDYSLYTQTHNQQEALFFLESALRADKKDNSFFRASDRSESVFNVNALMGELTALENTPDDIRHFLDMLSGQFLAQTIARAALNDPSEFLYPQIKKTLVSGLKDNKDGKLSLFFHSLWAQGSGHKTQVDGPKQTMGTFKDVRYDATVGFNILEEDRFVAGAFGSGGLQELRQGANESNIENYGAGVYGGMFWGRFENKAYLGFGWHNVYSKRTVSLLGGHTPRAAFYLYSVKAGLESAFKVYGSSKTRTLADAFVFAGLNGAAIYNRTVKEEGGGMMDLTVLPGAYERLFGFGGIRFKGKFWHADLRMNYFLSGNAGKSRMKIEWQDFAHEMKIEGANADFVSFTFTGGFEQEILKDIFVFGSGDITRSKGGWEHTFGGRAGVKYVFAMRKSIEGYRNWIKKTDPERQRQAREKSLEKELKKKQREETKEAARQRKEQARELRIRDRLLELERLEAERQKRLPRKTILSDRAVWGDGSWGDEDLIEMAPDELEEEKINKRSKVERIVAHVVVVKPGSKEKPMWRTLINADTADFEADSGDLTDLTKDKIRKSVEKILNDSSDIARVRVVRYGPEPSVEQLALAQLRASKIYDEIENNRENKRIQEAQNQDKFKEAQERRMKALASYKLKAASFEINSSILSASAQENIYRLAQEILEKPFNRVTVEGHTDNVGTSQYNENLSRQRASAVYVELVRAGIVKEKLQTIGFGSQMPIADNNSLDGRAANRRVEIFVE